jgi:WD repeat-containing protein mio
MVRSTTELEEDLSDLVEQKKYTTAAAWALFEGNPTRAVDILKSGGTDLLFVAVALDIKLKSNTVLDLGATEWSKALESHPKMADDPYLRAIYGYITTGDRSAIADEASLPLRDRVGVALRKFDDAKLTDWLTKQMEEAVSTGDIEGIVLAGITDNMVDILAKYVEKFMDYQTPILIMSFCYPQYISDVRCGAWRKNYQDLLQRNKKFILRVKFEQQSTIKSRLRDGNPVIKAPPRQVAIRCINCDAQSAHDLSNSGAVPTSAPGPSTTTVDARNPLTASGINAGLCCPKCGSHLSRCAVCMEVVGVPRSDRPELSNDPAVARMANFPTFCLKCKHVMHMDHSVAWFSRHVECPVPECRCQCNESTTRQN